MSLEEVLSFCSDLGFSAVDPTGYYFPDYPHVPTTAYSDHIREHAFRLGLSISGTGVRNDFTVPDDRERRAQVRHVKRWVEAAARLGAPVLRVFAGSGVPEGHTREEATAWLVDSLQACADYGRRHGVTVAVQNHAEFLETAAQVETVLGRVDGLGLILDIGSLGGPDPYDEIATLAPHAVSWQIKEEVTVQDEKVRTDLSRIVAIVNEAGYRGYLPLETLGPGDPREQVPRFLSAVRRALANG
jgi:sugar phosphate isomerase/epimerase